MKLNCCHVQGEKYPARDEEKAWSLASHVQGENENFIYLENEVKWRGSNWGRPFCPLGGSAISDWEVMAFCKQAMQLFAHSPAKSPWPLKAVWEGPGLSELKLVLTDTFRIHFITPGNLGECTWKKNTLNFHRISGTINESVKNLDVNAYCPLVSSQRITVSMA